MSPSRCFRLPFATFASIAILVLPPFHASAQQTNPDMMYFVQGEKYPKGLSDFQAFGLYREQTKGSKLTFHGWVMTDREDPDNSTCDMESVRVSGPSLSFAAKTRKGLRFTFDGRFLHSGDFRRYAGKDVPVVEGVVRKYRSGKKLAEANARFTCGAGG
jgi:hypothetical protein